MRHSFRVELLATVFIGIAILTLAMFAIGGWGLSRVRDRAIIDSARVLQRRAESYLERVAQARADGANQTLSAVRQLAAATAGYLAQPSVPAPSAPAPSVQQTADGRAYFYDTTTVLLPAGGDIQQISSDLEASRRLNSLVPGLIKSLPEIGRISYMSPNGVLRTFPHLNPTAVPQGWDAQTDLTFQASLPQNNPLHKAVWTALHPALDDPGQQVLSAVAPIYREDQFAGAIVVNVRQDRLIAYLGRLGIEQSGFTFLLDSNSRLMATGKEGQLRLLGRFVTPGEQSAIRLEQTRPALGPLLADMRAGRGGVATVDLDGRSYIIAYAPIAEVGWTLGLAMPLDEITADTTETAARITSMASETQRLELLAALLAVVVLSLLMSFMLQRQFVRPLAALIDATKAVAAGDLRPIAIRSKDELGQLALAFNSMTEALEASRAEIMATNQRLELAVRERTADLELAVARLEELFARQQELLRTLREVSTPVIPVVEGVLAMPLIGQIDGARAENATRALLERIERDRARTVLLDITGVPVIDTDVAQALLQTVAASRLLGAEVLLVGVAPEVAQTIVSLGIDMRGLRTAADLRSAVEQILRRRSEARQPAA
jgi:anti-anti-sigma factor